MKIITTRSKKQEAKKQRSKKKEMIAKSSLDK